MYFEKVTMLAIVTYMNDYNEGIQICVMFVLLSICLILQVKNSPYYTAQLNLLQSMALYVVSLFLAARLMIRTFAVD